MSFGFSVGDFLAVGQLITDIVASLNDAKGAKADYQELHCQLYLLNKTLQQLDQLQSSDPILTLYNGNDRCLVTCVTIMLSLVVEYAGDGIKASRRDFYRNCVVEL